MQQLNAEIDRIMDEGRIPSVSVCVRQKGREVFHRSAGMARLPDEAVVPDQPYDLASLTKVLATIPVVAQQMADGRLNLDASVRNVLPDVDPRITARHLLSHGSGYPAWAPLYDQVSPTKGHRRRQAVLDAARTTPLETIPGASHRYSDLGYLVLCELLEALGGDRLDKLLAPILECLEERDLRWGWPGAAATQNSPDRGGVVQGVVDDRNCDAMGGVSTHAGLFGTARAVARTADALREAWMGQRGDLPGQALATLAHSRGPGSHHLGFDGISPGYTSTGRHFPLDTVGHLGYTGTSLWITESTETVVTVLTNRIHPVDDLTAIREERPRLHDAVARDLGWARP